MQTPPLIVHHEEKQVTEAKACQIFFAWALLQIPEKCRLQLLQIFITYYLEVLTSLPNTRNAARVYPCFEDKPSPQANYRT
jgi:hypothetical protein